MMLTKKQNFLETIHGGTPDRLVNQFEYLELIWDPFLQSCICSPGEEMVTDWGYTVAWPEGTPGVFPIHTPSTIVVKDLTKWRDVVHPPDPWSYTDEQWAAAEEQAVKTDRNDKYVTATKTTGLFERLHHLMTMETAFVSFYEEPEATKELIEFIAEWEIEHAKTIIKHIKPNALFQHDDWGTQIGSFFSPELFEEFFVPSYKKIYNFWRANGIEIIVHHCDSYARNLVPQMIEMGIDVWQGAVQENDIPAVLAEYGGQISIQAGLDSGKYDKEDWSHEKIRAGLEEIVSACGKHYLIPCGSQGGAMSTYPGVYEAISEEIDALSKRIF